MGLDNRDWYKEEVKARRQSRVDPWDTASASRRSFGIWPKTLLVFIVIGGLFWLVENNYSLKSLRDQYSNSTHSKPLPQPPINLSRENTRSQVTSRQEPEIAVINKNYEFHSGQCTIVHTKPIEKTSKKVYRWKDESGVWQFSDRAPSSGVGVRTAKIDRVINSVKRFNIFVDAKGTIVPPFLQDKIRQRSEAIYQFLTLPLNAEEIRQSDIRVHILGSRKDFFNAYGQLKAGKLVPAGFYTSKTNEAYVLAQKSYQQTEKVAIHETFHVIMAALYQVTPTWLNEGMAEYYESLSNSKKSKQESIRALKKYGLMPLNRLLQINGDQWKSSVPAQAYASAWLSVSHLMRTQHGQRTLLYLLRVIKQNPCASVSSVNVINQRYPGGVHQLEREMASWMKRNFG